jgi:hypothetical protein
MKPTFEASNAPRRYDRTAPGTDANGISDARMRYVLGMLTDYPLTDARGQSARTLTADKLAAPISPLVFADRHVVTRSNKQRGTKGEA